MWNLSFTGLNTSSFFDLRKAFDESLDLRSVAASPLETFATYSFVSCLNRPLGRESKCHDSSYDCIQCDVLALVIVFHPKPSQMIGGYGEWLPHLAQLPSPTDAANWILKSVPPATAPSGVHLQSCSEIALRAPSLAQSAIGIWPHVALIRI